jgi:hypothetical protein
MNVKLTSWNYLISIYRCLKLIFENATAGRNTGCRSVVNPTHPAFPSTPYIPLKCRGHSDDRHSSHEGLYGNEKAVIKLKHKPTSWSWVLLDQPPVVQPLKNFPAFYGNRRFITVLTKAVHWPLSWVRSILSIPPHPISIRSILILFTHPTSWSS